MWRLVNIILLWLRRYIVSHGPHVRLIRICYPYRSGVEHCSWEPLWTVDLKTVVSIRQLGQLASFWCVDFYAPEIQYTYLWGWTWTSINWWPQISTENRWKNQWFLICPDRISHKLLILLIYSLLTYQGTLDKNFRINNVSQQKSVLLLMIWTNTTRKT